VTDKLGLCLVGAGGMGSRHLIGAKTLADSGMSNIEIVGVCDLREESAQRAADTVEEMFGRRPAIHLSMDDAIADPAIDGFDVVTEASSHLAVTLPALAAGKHVMSEKPLGITIRSCLAMIEAAAASGAVLATAENYRRDPPNRLVKAILDAGLLGHVHLIAETRIGGNDRIITTPWRHLKDKGAIGLDMGVHLTDLFQYYGGEIQSVFGEGFIAEPVRRRRDAPSRALPAYVEELKRMPEQMDATGEDAVIASYRLASGARAQLTYINSGPGQRYLSRTIHGREGSLRIGKDRNGIGPILDRGGEVLQGKEILPLVPGFQLDEITTRLFGENAVEYDIGTEAADAACLAIELHDYADAVLTGRAPEVDGWGGMTAVAGILGAYESGLAGRPVTMAELLSGEVSAYQDPIDEALGLLDAGAKR
jgi:predicted dehydrogenase